MSFMLAKTESGLLRGLPAGNQTISVFKGIPYAKPPVGELRWKLPQPVEPWEGVKDCYRYGKIAVQEWMPEGSFYRKEFWPTPLEMSEDCLYLNVWTPAETPEEKLPVSVWIHGGGLRQGFGHKLEIDGEAFAKKGIVFVSINYRLNMMGFLAHPELSAEAERETGHRTSGNYGIFDQIAALKWVQKNIAGFGGDPEKVTIFGQSGGGRSVCTHACSPLSKGLFRGAIMQSGGGLGGQLTEGKWDLEDAEEVGLQLFEYMGIKNIEEARKIPAVDIMEAGDRMFKEKGRMAAFTPNHDGYLLPETYRDIMLGNKVNDANYMIGSNADDMRRPAISGYENIKADAEKKYGKNADKYLEIIHADDPEKYAELAKDFGPEDMFAQDLGWVRMLSRLGRRPGYLYMFEQVPPGADGMGAFHAAEHMYLHMTFLRSWRNFSGEDFEFAKRINSYWTNFIKYGDPNGEGLEKWEPYTEENKNMMHLQGKCHSGKVYDSERLWFITDHALGNI